MSTPNGGIANIYPGTFDTRSSYSFQQVFAEISRRVTGRVYHGYSLPTKIPKGDIVDLLSGHSMLIKFMKPSGKFVLRPIRLENVPRIDEETRLLLLDMAAGIEAPFVIDRLSRMALQWPEFVFRFDNAMAMIINPRANNGVSVWQRDPAYFLCLVNLHTVGTENSAPTSYGDVVIELYPAAQYALMRAHFEPEIPPEFPYVVRARFGLRTCVVGITEEAPRVFGHVTKRVFDVPNRMFGRFLVPGLYIR